MCPIQKCDTATKLPSLKGRKFEFCLGSTLGSGKITGSGGLFSSPLSLSFSFLKKCSYDAYYWSNMSRNQIPTGKPWRRGRARGPAHDRKESEGKVVWSREFWLDFLWICIPPHSMYTFASLLCLLPTSHPRLFSQPYFSSGLRFFSLYTSIY